MAQYKGIIAGIGDKSNKINLISPQFDARIYNFIIGKNCIIDGLELNNKTLSAGACVCQGYRGVIDTSIKLVTTMGYIYGVFKVNFDNDKPDEFYIETSSTKIERKDDILHGTGVYYLELYYNGLVRLPRDYPNSAVYADKSQFVSNTIGEKATATTQDVNDNSTKVATTEYVHNQIEEQIKPATTTLTLFSFQGPTTESKKEVGKLLLKRKAKQVVAIATINSPASEYNGVIFPSFLDVPIPNEFLPKNIAYITLPFAITTRDGYLGEQKYEGAYFYKILPDGTLSIKASDYEEVDSFSIIGKKYDSGWETN